MLVAGWLQRARVDLVKCVSNDLMVPAQSEIVLEGYCDPAETRTEGPFGDHTGYYSLADQYPVFHIMAITHRRQPIYPATIVGRPPMEDGYLGLATERMFLPAIRLVLPEVIDMHMPLEGGFHNLVLVRIKKSYPGQARKVMYALWGLGLMMLAKTILVVDDDTDVRNPAQVAWRALNNVDPRRDLVVVDGPLDALDHASPAPHYGAKLGIDATRKLTEEGHTRPWPDDIVMSPEVAARVTERWREIMGG
jgi:4-hydroxy-3-polyprenylbenzoate decarboxylase